MALSAQESQGLVAAGAPQPEEDPLSMPSPTVRRGGRFLKMSAGRLLGGALALTALVSVCRFAMPGAALRGSSMRGVQSLASEGGDEEAAPAPLLFQTKDATPEVQELCDDVKEKVPGLLKISGWSSVHLRDYQALSYCTDGMDYIVRVMVGVPYEEAKVHEEGVYLQLLLRKPSELEESRATQIFGAMMVTPVDSTVCGALPILPKIELPAPARLADIKLPKAEIPEVKPLKVDLPKVELPEVELPKVELPPAELPEVELPKVESPKDDEKEAPAPAPASADGAEAREAAAAETKEVKVLENVAAEEKRAAGAGARSKAIAAREASTTTAEPEEESAEAAPQPEEKSTEAPAEEADEEKPPATADE